MNITFVIPSMLRGGAERVISILCNELSKDGNNVSLCLTENANEILYPLSPQVKIKDLTCERSRFIYKIPYYVNSLRRTFKEEKTDIVISFITRTNIFSILASKLARVPVIVSERNNPYLVPANSKLRRFRDFIYKFANGAVFQTRYARDYYDSELASRSVIIKNPFDLKITYGPYKCRSNNITTTCRLVRQKNIELLVKAFANISDKIPTYSLNIFGDGPLKDEIQHLINDLGLSEKAFLMGVDNDVITKIAQSKIFALPSDFEGLSNSLAEALCVGAACVATDSPTYGNRDLMTDGKSGFLVPVNDVDSFADKLLLLASDDDLGERFSNEGVKLNSIINASNIIIEWKKYIDQIILTQNKPRGGAINVLF